MSILRHIKAFGCDAYYIDFSQEKMKFESNGKKGVYLGIYIEYNCIYLVREVILMKKLHQNLLPEYTTINYKLTFLITIIIFFEFPIINTNENENIY